MIKIGIIDTEIRTDQIIFDKTHFCNADYKTSVLHGTEMWYFKNFTKKNMFHWRKKEKNYGCFASERFKKILW